MMEMPKSTPDLDHPLNKQRKSRRDSRAHRISREVKQNPGFVFNLFHQGNDNMLPEHLQQQIEKMGYISSSSIKSIQFSQMPKRKSNFEKNLVMMQQIVQQQQDKYCMMKEGKQVEFSDNQMQMQMFANCRPLNLDEEDQISLQINGFYEERDRIDDDFNIFTNQMDEEQGQENVFYSNNELEAPEMMDQEVNGYFG